MTQKPFEGDTGDESVQMPKAYVSAESALNLTLIVPNTSRDWHAESYGTCEVMQILSLFCR